ncbi:hypothetical protein EW093_13455 [Thiospirochaeta perfilievii]|uniref:DUF1302 family protein n=1 Tax=Thiospirochaeta perfilievii TaxID=252967 RepID=A0A5C1QGD8_9SPIO|nr:hypothetical protein [Thiospirochaeta perfilievii]QEN05674.1 hypothetical protein EW093_13455 [Thiospirochaeta perfilievii]
MRKILFVAIFLVTGFIYADLHFDLSPNILLGSSDVVDTPTLLEFYDWLDRPSYSKLYLDLGDDIFKIFFQLELKSDLKSNFSIDPNYPEVGYGEFNFDIFKLSIGRRKLATGPGFYGLNIAQQAPYFDHIWFEAGKPEVGRWRYYFTTITTDNLATGQISEKEDPYKTYISHSFSYVWDNFILNIIDSSLIYGRVPDLQEAAPFIHYHGLYQRGQNVILDINFDWLVNSRLRLYGEALIDEFQLSIESSDSNPGAMGFILGSQFKIKDGRGAKKILNTSKDHLLRTENFIFDSGLYISFESMFTTKYLYNRDVELGKITNPILYMWDNDSVIFNTYFGAAYGPDALVNRLGLTYNVDPFKMDLTFESFSFGGFGINGSFDPPYNNWLSITSLTNSNFRIALNLEWIYNSNQTFYSNIKYDFGLFNNLQFLLGWGMKLF